MSSSDAQVLQCCWAVAIGNVHRKFGEKEADTLITVLCFTTGVNQILYSSIKHNGIETAAAVLIILFSYKFRQ